MSKLLVITGGTKGIGRAIIKKFINSGFDVATCARNANDLKSLKMEFGKSGEMHTLAADMSIKSQVVEFIDFVTKLNKPIDVLVNNAGYFLPGEVSTEPDGNLEAMMKVNLYNPYYLTRGIVPLMKHVNAGHIFNMCSVASFMAYKNGGSYAITKFALLGFSKCLREELKEFGIRVTSVMPGATMTESWEGTDLPESRFMPAEDIANMVYATCSLSSRSVVEEIVIRPQLGDI